MLTEEKQPTQIIEKKSAPFMRFEFSKNSFVTQSKIGFTVKEKSCLSIVFNKRNEDRLRISFLL